MIQDAPFHGHPLILSDFKKECRNQINQFFYTFFPKYFIITSIWQVFWLTFFLKPSRLFSSGMGYSKRLY